MNKLFYITFVILLSGCYTDTLTLDELGAYQNKLVVNSVLVNQERVSVQLTNSTATTSEDFPQAIEDATVVLTVNGTDITLPYVVGAQAYETSSVTLNAGDVISMEARRNGFPFVNANAVIPNSVSATGSLIPNGGTDTSGTLSDLVQIEFTDPAGQDNYYKINFFYYSNTLGEFIPMFFSIADPDLAEYSNRRLNDGSMLFTDAFFDGESKTLGTVAPFGLVLGNPGDKYMITLENISEDLYRYHSSLQNAQDSKTGGFSNAFNNAVVIHSNVNNGLGIFAASNRTISILQ